MSSDLVCSAVQVAQRVRRGWHVERAVVQTMEMTIPLGRNGWLADEGFLTITTWHHLQAGFTTSQKLVEFSGNILILLLLLAESTVAIRAEDPLIHGDQIL